MVIKNFKQKKINIYFFLVKKFLSLFVGLFFIFSTSYAEEKLDIQKQLVGIVGAISGTVKTETRDLKAGDKIY